MCSGGAHPSYARKSAAFLNFSTIFRSWDCRRLVSSVCLSQESNAADMQRLSILASTLVRIVRCVFAAVSADCQPLSAAAIFMLQMRPSTLAAVACCARAELNDSAQPANAPAIFTLVMRATTLCAEPRSRCDSSTCCFHAAQAAASALFLNRPTTFMNRLSSRVRSALASTNCDFHVLKPDAMARCMILRAVWFMSVSSLSASILRTRTSRVSAMQASKTEGNGICTWLSTCAKIPEWGVGNRRRSCGLRMASRR